MRKRNARISLHWQQNNNKNTLHEHTQNLLEHSVGSQQDYYGITPEFFPVPRLNSAEISRA